MRHNPSLADQYRQQSNWRDWAKAMNSLPDRREGLILDLGCAVGEQSALLSHRGFSVIGVDGNEALLDEARKSAIPNATFLHGDLLSLDRLNLPMVDGIWSSFVAAYFPAFPEALAHWMRFLKPGGWIALVEMTHLLNHEPLKPETRRTIEEFYDEAFRMNRYDFRMGNKLKDYLTNAGSAIDQELVLDDKELSFHGAAAPQVLLAWQERLHRMGGLQSFLGESFKAFEAEFLKTLSHPDHVSRCKVYQVIAKKSA